MTPAWLTQTASIQTMGGYRIPVHQVVYDEAHLDVSGRQVGMPLSTVTHLKAAGVDVVLTLNAAADGALSALRFVCDANARVRGVR